MNELEIKQHLKKITESKGFYNSDKYKRLLSYLTEATLKGEKPKEITIGIDVYNYNAEDIGNSNIRVYIHNLRKKLDTYYKKEGSGDTIFFSIPKGGYSLKFKSKKDKTPLKINKTNLFFILSFILIVSLTLIYILSQNTNSNKLKKTEFWNDIIKNKKETVIIAGDFFMFYDKNIEKNEGRSWNIRDIKIDSKEQLKQYIDSKKNITPEDLAPLNGSTYMPRDALFSMPYLLPFFIQNKITYEITLSSVFNWDTFIDYNIIYIGSFKNLKTLSLLTDKLNIKYNNQDYTISVFGSKGTKVYSQKYLSGKTNIDYSLVFKIPGPKGNTIYFFISNHDIGCIESVKYFTNINSIKSFEKNYTKDNKYFKSIFRAEGIDRTSVVFELIKYETLADSTINNFWHYKNN